MICPGGLLSASGVAGLDLLKQTVIKTTPGFPPGGAGGWCGVGSGGHGDRGSVEAEVGKSWRRWKRTRDRKGGGGERRKAVENRRERRERRYGRRRESRVRRG